MLNRGAPPTLSFSASRRFLDAYWIVGPFAQNRQVRWLRREQLKVAKWSANESESLFIFASGCKLNSYHRVDDWLKVTLLRVVFLVGRVGKDPQKLAWGSVHKVPDSFVSSPSYRDYDFKTEPV